MDQFDRYIRAFEAFESEMDALDFSYRMSAFIGFEAEGDPNATKAGFRAKAGAAWQWLRTQAEKLANWFRGIMDKIGGAISRIGATLKRAPNRAEVDADAFTKAEAATKRAEEAVKMAEDLVKESVNATNSNIEEAKSIRDRVEEHAKKFREAMETDGKIVFESDLSGAMEADGEGSKRVIDFSGLRNKMNGLLTRISGIGKSVTGAIDRVRDAINKEANGPTEGEPQTVRQKLLSTLLRALTSVGKAIAGIPGMVTRAFSAIFRKKTPTEKYEGTKPDADEVEVE